jgi:hypothetical protein
VRGGAKRFSARERSTKHARLGHNSSVDQSSADETHVSPQGLDEALHRAVVTTRYGCQRQGGQGEYSKASYRVLHKRFPESPWAQKTPFWFDCDHFYLGCSLAH